MIAYAGWSLIRFIMMVLLSTHMRQEHALAKMTIFLVAVVGGGGDSITVCRLQC